MSELARRSLILAALDGLKAQNIIDLPIGNISGFTDHLIIASGTSSTHVKALADKVVQTAKEHGIEAISQEGDETCEWILVDLGDVVVNIMQPRTRDFYYLEGLWAV